MLIAAIVRISENRKKAEELTNRSNDKKNNKGKSFRKILEKEIIKTLERR